MQHPIRPGEYPDLSNDAYHGGPGTSKSGLDIIHVSAEKFAFAKSPEAPPREATAAQAFGSAYHMIVLEPALFVKTYTLGISMADVPHAIDSRDELVAMVERLNFDRKAKLPTSGAKADVVERIISAQAEDLAEGFRSERAYLENMKGAELKQVIDMLNASRAGLLSTSGTRHELAALLRANGVEVTLWSDVQAEWLANNADRIVISPEDWATLHAMREKLMAHPAAGRLLRKRGAPERSFYWVDIETGELLRCRPDYLTDCGIIVDLKTARDASEDGFISSIQSYRYDVQHPFYVDGITAAIEQACLDRVKPKAFVFIGQEKEAPYAVGVYWLDPEDVELGRMEYRADLRKLAECRTANAWPGYGDGIQQISLTSWHRQKTALASAPQVLP